MGDNWWSVFNARPRTGVRATLQGASEGFKPTSGAVSVLGVACIWNWIEQLKN